MSKDLVPIIERSVSRGGRNPARREAFGLGMSHVENGASVYLAGAAVKGIAAWVTNRDKWISELARDIGPIAATRAFYKSGLWFLAVEESTRRTRIHSGNLCDCGRHL